MDPEQKKRLKTVGESVSALALLLGLHFVLFLLTGKGIPCVIRLLTGYQCPGCGMTHAAAALLRGEISLAMEYNPLVLSVLPALALYLVRKAYVYVRKGQEQFRLWEYPFLAALLIATVWFWIWRNR